MGDVEHTYQNGHTKVYTEENDDGTVTEYQEERYIMEGGDSNHQTEANSSEVVVLQDDDDVKVYQQHEVLPDGREMITTTTITLDENGEATEETVTEIVESEEVEVEESEEEEEPVQEEEPSQDAEEPTQEEEELAEEEQDMSAPEDKPEPQIEPEAAPVEIGEKVEQAEELTDESQEEIAELPPTSPTQEDSAQTTRPFRRHLSYEEFEEQYTEYKPPKRYEKKQTDKAADKAAPRISIMGIPNNTYSSVPVTGDHQLTSPRTSSHGDGDSLPEESTTNQPTRTQGSVIRRMDQGANVDPANIIRAEDKPDIGAELPTVGTSKSLKDKFQSLENGPSKPVDFSQPPKRERPRTGQFGYNAAAPVVNTSEASDHRVPEFEGGEVENTPQVRDDVVREADRNDTEELPETGQARNLLSKWGQMEQESKQVKEYKPSGVGSKPTVTPLRPTSRVEVVNTEEYQEPQPEGGEFENNPVQRTDVVKESDPAAYEEELPTVGMAKSLMSQFKQKEAEAKQVQNYKPSGAGNRKSNVTAPRVQSRPTSTVSAEDHVEPQFEGGEVENQPEVRADLVRESDRTDTEELPETGYAKNLKARFRELQDQQKSADYVEHRPSGIGSKATPTPLGNRNSLNVSINSDSTSNDEVDSRVEPQVEGGEFENEPVRRTDVIREDDRMDEEELPEAGLAKNLMNQFKNLESQKSSSYKPSGIGNKATPSKLHIMAGRSSYSAKGVAPENAPPPVTADSEPVQTDRPLDGEFESTPVVRDDVMREDMRNDMEELPEQGQAKNIMSRFKNMESENKSQVHHTPSKIASKPTPTPLRPRSAVSDVNDAASEASSTSHVESEGGEYENSPEINHNVIRSTDSNENDFIPSAGAAKSLMNN